MVEKSSSSVLSATGASSTKTIGPIERRKPSGSDKKKDISESTAPRDCRSKNVSICFGLSVMVSGLIGLCVVITLRAEGKCTKHVPGSCKYGVAMTCLTDNCSNVTTWNNSKFRMHVIQSHNTLRNNKIYFSSTAVVPSNMIQLEWNSELEAAALRWLQHLCKTKRFVRPDCLSTASFNSVGQILMRLPMPWKGLYHMDDLVGMIYSTVTSWSTKGSSGDVSDAFPYSNISRNPSTFNYYQLMWARTYAIGCAAIQLPDGFNATYMLCNYGPSGNIVGQNISEVGEPASACPIGTTSAGSLCAVVDEIALRKTLGIEKKSVLRRNQSAEDRSSSPSS